MKLNQILENIMNGNVITNIITTEINETITSVLEYLRENGIKEKMLIPEQADSITLGFNNKTKSLYLSSLFFCKIRLLQF